MVQCLARQEVSDMEKIFIHLDKTHEGSVQLWKLKEALAKSNIVANDVDINAVFDELDYNNDTYMYFSDFLTAVVSHKIKDRNRSDNLLKATFDRFDVDNSGFIS